MDKPDSGEYIKLHQRLA